MSIVIEKLSSLQLESLRIKEWPIWQCEPSAFAWHYDQEESCYILEGEVTVKSAEQEVEIVPGDYVTFPRGLSCHWTVRTPVRKHYIFR